MKRKTQAEFVKEVHDLIGDEYTVLGEYRQNKIKVKMRHEKCGYEYMVSPNMILRGRRCPKCAGNMKKDTIHFKEEVYNLTGNEYTVKSEYTGTHNKVEFIHNKCGNIFKMNPHNFLDGQRCPKCFGDPKKTTEQFKSEVYNLVQNEYEVLGEYTRNMHKIKMKHKACGCIYEVTPNMFLRGNRCPDCFKSVKKTQKKFEAEIKELYGDEYSVLGEYHNTHTKILMQHNKCGNIWMTYPCDLLLDKTHCPECGYSRGEERISNYLKNNKINYTLHKSFKDLVGVNNGLLSYDFYLNTLNTESILIEYQGEYHDHTVSTQTDEEFAIQQEHDKRKREYANLHNIKLLEIWYWDFNNIENILTQALLEKSESA
jgi:predicted Zn-ribbon and HTH transcriptional regulator